MIDRTVFQSFLGELEKISMSFGNKALLSSGLIGGGIAGAVGKDMYQDAQEGKVQRKHREMLQKQQIRALSQGGSEHG